MSDWSVMSARRLAGLGVATVAASIALYAWLHLAPASGSLDWRTRTISQYALMANGWAFDTATLLLAAGSAVILAALVRARLVGRASAAALALWVLGLVGVVWFEKHNWAVGPSTSGDVHRVASVLAFVSLPAAALLAGVPRLRRPYVRVPAAVITLAGSVSLLCFAPIMWAVLAERWTGVQWWQAIPLGAVERMLGLAEVITLLLLAWWAAGAGRVRRPAAAPEP